MHRNWLRGDRKAGRQWTRREMDLELSNKVAVVTGASRGIGRAIVETLAAEGVAVVANHFGDSAGASATERALVDAGAKAVFVSGDIGERETSDALIEAALDRFGRLDIAVHNAGITTRQPLIDTPHEDFDRVLRTNLYGAYFLAKAAAGTMQDRGTNGALIAITSLHGRVAKADMGAYCASKAAIDMLFKQLAVELAPAGIRANTVAPGTIDTGMNPIYHASDPASVARRARLMDRVPMRSLGDPMAVARTVAFVASPVSSYTTGATIYVDGGYTADGTPR